MVTAHLICMLRVGHVVYGDFIKCNHIFVENDQVTSPFFIRMTLTYTAVQKVEVGKIFKCYFRCSYANPVCNYLVKNTVNRKIVRYYHKLNKLFTI